MSVTPVYDNKPLHDVQANTTADLVNRLKAKPASEFPEGYDLDSLFKEIEVNLAATIGGYASKDISLRVAQIAKFTDISQLVSKGQDGQILPNVSAHTCDEEGALQFAINFTNAGFHQFISVILGRGEITNSNVLSAAQIRLFLQFAQQIMIDIAEIFNFESKISSPTISEIEQLTTMIETQVFTIMGFELVMDDHTYKFGLLLPLIFFEPARSNSEVYGNSVVQQSIHEIWQAKLRTQISGLDIPLQMHFSSSEMALENVQALNIGNSLGNPLDLETVRICDAHGECEFFAAVTLDAEKIQLVVHGRKTE